VAQKANDSPKSAAPSFRARLWHLLEGEGSAQGLGAWISGALVVLILANAAAVVLESIPKVRAHWGPSLRVFELLSIAVFTLEYLTRVWASREAGPRWRYVTHPLAIVDFLAIAPYYLVHLLGIDLRFLRLFRLLRLFKLARYLAPLSVLGNVLRSEARMLIAGSIVVLMILVISACVVHLLEQHAQPDVFGTVPQAMWWAVVTLTTVGYGDVTPVTVPGRIVGAIIMLMGVGMVALPAGLMASRFSEEMNKRRSAFRTKIRQGMTDSLLSTEELRHLEMLRDDLGLSHDDARELIHQALQHPDRCPHCGGLLVHHPPEGEDPLHDKLKRKR